MTWQEWDEWKERARENPWKYEPEESFDDDELEVWNDDYDY